MEAIDYKNILLETAVSAIACDGDIDKREIEALKNIEKNSPYFSSEDLSETLEKSLHKCSADITKYQKSVFNKILTSYKNLKLIQLNKNDIFDIEYIYSVLGKYNHFRFIIFIDDLSFEKIDSDYKIIKSTLDGSIQNQPTNILLYVSSNRRHLMPRDMIDNERSSAIHTDESIEEKISLSDRFGLWIGFHKLSQKDYLKIIETYCEHYNINYDEEISKQAIQWSLQRGNRTGRAAWQFILNTASDQNLKIKI